MHFLTIIYIFVYIAAKRTMLNNENPLTINTSNELELLGECYSIGAIFILKSFLQRVNDNTTIRPFPLIQLANDLPTIKERGQFSIDYATRMVVFIKNNKQPFTTPIPNLARYDYQCNNCSHEFWKGEVKRYPLNEGDSLKCPHCNSDNITKL